MIMHTFAESHDFTGKMVYPFTTHAMSGLGSTVSRYEAACRGATVGVGLAVQGESVATDGPTAVGPWLAGMSLGPG